MSRVQGVDGVEDQITSALDVTRTQIPLVPGVGGCNVSITATGQSHLRALNDITRGPERHGRKLGGIWREQE